MSFVHPSVGSDGGTASSTDGEKTEEPEVELVYAGEQPPELPAKYTIAELKQSSHRSLSQGLLRNA